MTGTAEGAMSPRDAVAALEDLEGYEPELTARTTGITWMIWGTAIPGVFMTYNAATPWLETQAGLAWMLSFLWIPWILGASLATNWLWRNTAVTLDWDLDAREGWLYAAGFTLAFFALAGGVWLLAQGLGESLGTNGWMMITGGLLTIVIGLVYRRQGIPRPGDAVLGGLFLTAAGVAIAAAALDPPVIAGLLSAGLVGLVYYGLGIRLYLRG